MTSLSERLNSALAEAKVKKPYLSKSGLAKHCGVRPSTVTDWFNGTTKTMNARCGLLAAEYLSVSSVWLVSGEGDRVSQNVKIVEDENVATDLGLIAIPEFEVQFACGDFMGEPSFHELEDCSKAWYRPDWFQQRQINPANCKRFKVRGPSMEPLMYDGDTILVDCTPHEIIPGKVYAFCVTGQMRVKCLYPMLNGSMLVKSLNQNVPDEIIPLCDMESFVLIGRVRDRSGGSFF